MNKYENNPQIMNEVIEKLYSRCGEQQFEIICGLLEKMYLHQGHLNKNYRHEYSDVSGKMEEVRNAISSGENPLELQNISTNINLLYEYAISKNKIYINYLFKLKDHILLEVRRIEYSDRMNNSIIKSKADLKTEIDDASNKIKDLKKQIESSNTMLQKIEEKNKKNQREAVAILGIFAAIVLSFTGGFAFTSSVLENFQNGTIYRWLIIVILVAIVLINILYALFFYLDRIINNNTPKNIKPLWCLNTVLTLLIMLVVIVWGNGWVEQVQKKNLEPFYETNFQNTISSSDNINISSEYSTN